MSQHTQSHDALQNVALVSAIRRVCELAGSRNYLVEVARGCEREGLTEAVAKHDDSKLFGWLLSAFNYQGVSDAVASRYLGEHGQPTMHDIEELLALRTSCPKLAGYWTFANCGYRKSARTCAEPDHIDHCPLPHHALRNGRLNQTAYSLYLFMRDVAGGDFVNWIDCRLSEASRSCPAGPPRRSVLRDSLLDPLGNVHGVSSKVLSMTLSSLLMGAASDRALWIEAGAGMIAVDTLVHNWLHRMGILAACGAEHSYGIGCYGDNGCAAIIEAASGLIDARDFNLAFPADFPRFVQKAIWWFCAQAGQDECNGNRVDDRFGCTRADCPMGRHCARLPLRSQTASAFQTTEIP